MSQEFLNKIAALDKEIVQLKDQLTKNSQGVENLFTQIEAARDQINESTHISLNLRTTIIALKKENQKLGAYAKDLQDKLDALNKASETDKVEKAVDKAPAKK